MLQDMDTERNFGLMRGYKRDEAEKGYTRRGLDILSDGQHEARNEEDTHMADEDTEEAMLMRTY